MKKVFFLFLSCLFLNACQALHLPSFFKKTSAKAKSSASDQFAPGAFSPSCRPGGISVLEENILSVGMRMASDGKWCALEMAQDSGGSYPSSGVPLSPQHGKVYIYDGRDGFTYIAYKPEFGFKGRDHFRVFLLTGNEKPRKNVEITVEVHTPEMTAGRLFDKN